ncbi:hypothetical protein C8A00DRAFT_46756 [Chaetomidium leptoderma]|uniref:Uncharacterized protein n=1 Tax=Chaetomidium leptoderma TaxID=669021 RepID=A0AAN6VE22_9PEZI|nr:hypothetical protein C8A00DRAFT_46756 [Chaetomidium leptoderma]
MLTLYTETPLLIDLHFTLHWSTTTTTNTSGDGITKTKTNTHTQKFQFPPTTFAANVIADETPELFLHSLDLRCLDRIRAMTRYTVYCFDKPVNYEVERAFLWEGTTRGGRGLAIRGLSAEELGSQLRMVRDRGYRDWVRVDMAVEIEAGEELRRRG